MPEQAAAYVETADDYQAVIEGDARAVDALIDVMRAAGAVWDERTECWRLP